MPELTPPRAGSKLPTDPEEMYKVLTWQNEQLVQLREQVNQLLSIQDVSDASLNQSAKSNSTVTDCGTQTSAPATPVKRPLAPAAIEDGISFVQLNDLAAESRECSVASEGRVIQEKILKETEEIKVVPLSSPEVICKDLAPPEDIHKMLDDHELKIHEPSMIGRLREMGVSFIQPKDLQQPARAARSDVSMWHPTAAEPSVLSHTETTTDFSLMLNSAALKYLDDRQLTEVASRGSVASSSNDTYGLPENEMSMATKDFLQRNKLLN